MMSLISSRTLGRLLLVKNQSPFVVGGLAPRFLSDKSGGKSNNQKEKQSNRAPNNNKNEQQQQPTSSFRPRRQWEAFGSKKKKVRVPRNPMKTLPGVSMDGSAVPNPKDDFEATFGPLVAGVIRDLQKEKREPMSHDERVEEDMRTMDYLLSEDGSLEDLVGERRILSESFSSKEEADDFMLKLDQMIHEARLDSMDLEDEFIPKRDNAKAKLFGDIFDERDDVGIEDRDPNLYVHYNQKAFGPWSEYLVKVSRTTKLWRGGRLESYRALIVGGNMNGCGGFGIGKAKDPIVAVEVASRHCKRNIFFVEPYQGDGLTRDLVGKQNSCIVQLRATDNGLRGNELCREILKRFGITNCVAKSHGNRNVYNVVRATFKALMTHESIEEIALKRGKRIVSVDRAMRMQI